MKKQVENKQRVDEKIDEQATRTMTQLITMPGLSERINLVAEFSIRNKVKGSAACCPSASIFVEQNVFHFLL